MTEPGSRLQAQRRVLLKRLAQLSEDVEEMVEATRDANSDDEHDPEGATIAFERAQLLALARQARVQLSEVDAALERVTSETFGVCERCGLPIAAERLEVRPVARHCIDCARARA